MHMHVPSSSTTLILTAWIGGAAQLEEILALLLDAGARVDRKNRVISVASGSPAALAGLMPKRALDVVLYCRPKLIKTDWQRPIPAILTELEAHTVRGLPSIGLMQLRLGQPVYCFLQT